MFSGWTKKAKPTDVDVIITVHLSERQVDAAMACRLSPEQYASRLMHMLADGSLGGALIVSDNMFEYRDEVAIKEKA